MFKKSAIVLFLLCTAIVSCNQASQSGSNSDSAQAAAVTAPDMHNAQNSLDVAGTYKGTLPCADCEGIETTITLNNDSTYSRTDKYLGKGNNEFKADGKWHFLADGNTIALNDGKDKPVKFKVGENTLTMLDTEGKEITGALAEHYVLKKQ
jgi:uncharacterized lipoprotein NlpE involved in copper resistance